MKRNNHIWSVTIVSGPHCRNRLDLTKKQAKEVFEKLAVDTTRNINNDYIDLMVVRRASKKCWDDIIEMERVGKGEYVYRFGKNGFTQDGYEAWQIVQSL